MPFVYLASIGRVIPEMARLWLNVNEEKMFKRLFVCFVALLLLQGCTTMTGIVLGVDSMTYCMMDYDFIADKEERRKACDEHVKFYADASARARQQEAQESAAYAQSDTKKTLDAVGAGIVAVGNAYQQNQTAGTQAVQRPDPRGCIKLTALVHDRMCGSPNDIRYEYVNVCSYPVNYYFCSEGLDGKWRCDVSGSGNTRPNGKGMLAACNLTERYAAGSCKGPCNLCGTHDLHPAYAERCGEDSKNKPE